MARSSACSASGRLAAEDRPCQLLLVEFGDVSEVEDGDVVEDELESDGECSSAMTQEDSRGGVAWSGIELTLQRALPQRIEEVTKTAESVRCCTARLPDRRAWPI